MCFHGNQHPSSIKHPFISLYSKYHPFIFICLLNMNSPVFPSLDDIYCTFLPNFAEMIGFITFKNTLMKLDGWTMNNCFKFFLYFRSAKENQKCKKMYLGLQNLCFSKQSESESYLGHSRHLVRMKAGVCCDFEGRDESKRGCNR